MVSSIKRTALATAVTVLGCAVTYVWHIKNEPKSMGDSESDVIAYIATTKKEIHRKGSNNALWEPAEELDRLRSGDSVRTSGDSEARIQFYQSQRYIDLEADSMIVIQKQESEINLELLEGSLFVNGVDKASGSGAAEPSKSTLTLKSQGGKVDLSKSTAQLSGSSKDKVDLKVIKGSAQFIKTSGKSETIQEGKVGGIGKSGMQVNAEKIKIMSPDNSKPYFTNALSPTPIIIKWSGFPTKAKITLESGTNRKKLEPTLTEKKSFDQLSIIWKPGVYYWKLKASDPDTKADLGESSIYKTDVIGRFPPTPIAPEPNFVLQTRKPTENITLRWNTPQEYKDVLVELQNDRTKQNIFGKRLPSSVDAQDIPNLPLGTYSWKLTAFPADGSEPLKSPDYRFYINEKKLVKIPIVWNSNLQETQYFLTDPKLSLMWDTEAMDRVHKWKIQIAPDGTDISKVEAIESWQPKFEKTVTKPGRYLAFVSALDEENEPIGNSEVKPFNIQPLPLLIAPKLLPDDSSEFLARPDGTFILHWNAVNEASNYAILIKDKDEKTVTQVNSTIPNLKLSNLMPGLYTVEINAIDKFGRDGEKSQKRKIQVPDKSEVKAPTLKKIKVN